MFAALCTPAFICARVPLCPPPPPDPPTRTPPHCRFEDPILGLRESGPRGRPQSRQNAASVRSLRRSRGTDGGATRSSCCPVNPHPRGTRGDGVVAGGGRTCCTMAIGTPTCSLCPPVGLCPRPPHTHTHTQPRTHIRTANPPPPTYRTTIPCHTFTLPIPRHTRNDCQSAPPPPHPPHPPPHRRMALWNNLANGPNPVEHHFVEHLRRPAVLLGGPSPRGGGGAAGPGPCMRHPPSPPPPPEF